MEHSEKNKKNKEIMEHFGFFKMFKKTYETFCFWVQSKSKIVHVFLKFKIVRNYFGKFGSPFQIFKKMWNSMEQSFFAKFSKEIWNAVWKK